MTSTEKLKKEIIQSLNAPQWNIPLSQDIGVFSDARLFRELKKRGYKFKEVTYDEQRDKRED